MEDRLKFIKQLDVTISTIFMLSVFVVVMLQILSRILPGNAISWTVEMGEILLAGIIWMGIGSAVLTNSHVRFDMVLSKLPHKTKKLFYIVGNIAFAIFLIILAYYTIELLNFYINSNTRTPSLRWNKAIIRLPVLIGCTVGATRMLMQAYYFATDKLPLPSADSEVAEVLASTNLEINASGEEKCQ